MDVAVVTVGAGWQAAKHIPAITSKIVKFFIILFLLLKRLSPLAFLAGKAFPKELGLRNAKTQRAQRASFS
jgi:hypothetical protein